MRSLNKCAAWGLVALLASAACLPLPVLAAGDGERFRDIYEREWAFRLREFPMFASYVGVHDYDDRLGRVSEADQARRHAFWKGIRAELDDVSCARLEREDCINYRIFVQQIDNFIAEYETRAYLLTFNSDWGFFMGWARMPRDTRFTSVEDYRNYLGRLHELPEVMDQYIALMRRGLETGMTQPRVILDGRDKPIETQLVDRAEDSPFYQPFAELPESVASGDRAELLATARKAVSDDVIPAYRRLYQLQKYQLLGGARAPRAGMADWGLPVCKVYTLGSGGHLWLKEEVNPRRTARQLRRDQTLFLMRRPRIGPGPLPVRSAPAGGRPLSAPADGAAPARWGSAGRARSRDRRRTGRRHSGRSGPACGPPRTPRPSRPGPAGRPRRPRSARRPPAACRGPQRSRRGW